MAIGLPVPLLDLSVAAPLTSALPLVFELFDVIVDDAFDVVDDCGFSTMYLDLRSWTELLKLLTSSNSTGEMSASFDDATN